ncbi:DUF3768 domain-containing protein [Tardiphaga alba]|uniref:DUF3768 domain-containing protein n=1 Tax=Tardiphaga alba TaxID=340268 RepID=A0ABX8AEW1_9BRAD|nr:DUF3768 domain-containing protein [Tardiphaga alba]
MARIRDLNDIFRRKLPSVGKGFRVHVTDHVAALGSVEIAHVLETVRTFDGFGPDNDPYGEHDFGALDHSGNRLFWKIDCYDKWVQFGSPDPTDPSVTTRVLTIMRADEY